MNNELYVNVKKTGFKLYNKIQTTCISTRQLRL